MAEDSLPGRDLGTMTFPVDRSKVREFARALGDGQHGVRASQFSSKIAGLPSTATQVADAGLTTAADDSRGQANDITEDFGFPGEIIEEGQDDFTTALGEFLSDQVILSNDARTEEGRLSLVDFLLVRQEKLGDEIDVGKKCHWK